MPDARAIPLESLRVAFCAASRQQPSTADKSSSGMTFTLKNTTEGLSTIHAVTIIAKESLQPHDSSNRT